jgi:hypothetical protein
MGWNNVHSKYPKGFHLEIVTATVFSSLGGDSRGCLREILPMGAEQPLCIGPAGHRGDPSAYLTYADRVAVLSNLESERARAAKANAAEA